MCKYHRGRPARSACQHEDCDPCLRSWGITSAYHVACSLWCPRPSTPVLSAWGSTSENGARASCTNASSFALKATRCANRTSDATLAELINRAGQVNRQNMQQADSSVHARRSKQELSSRVPVSHPRRNHKPRERLLTSQWAVFAANLTN